jgi:tyrosine-protein kinase Etk/Wzc
MQGCCRRKRTQPVRHRCSIKWVEMRTLKNPSDLYASLFLSRTVQDAVIEKFNLQESYEIDDADDLRLEVAKRTKVSVGKDGVISLSYTDLSAQGSADIANGLIEAMYQVARRLARDDTRRRLEFYDGLLDEARKKYQVASQKLLEMERETGLTRLKGQEESSASAMAELRGLIATREVELQRASLVATDRNPDVMRLRQELGALRGQLSRLESSGRLPEQSKFTGKDDPKSKNLFVPFNQYADRRTLVEPLRQEIEIMEKLIADLTKAREFSRGDETRDLSVMQVLDYAVPPTRKAGPKVVGNAIIAFVIVAILTAVLVVLFDILFTDPQRRARWDRVRQSFVRPMAWRKWSWRHRFRRMRRRVFQLGRCVGHLAKGVFRRKTPQGAVGGGQKMDPPHE